MSFFLLLLLFLFVFFILVPIIRVWWTVHKMRKQARSFFDQMNGGAGPQQQAGASDPFADFFANMARERKKQHKKRKKIDPNVGEYVEFQEFDVKIEETTQTIDFTPENQISDVEWEDIEEK